MRKGSRFHLASVDRSFAIGRNIESLVKAAPMIWFGIDWVKAQKMIRGWLPGKSSLLTVAFKDCYNPLVSKSNRIDSPDVRWMEEALDEARLALELGEVPVGAVAVHFGRIIGRGYNRKEVDQDPTAHAEITALKKAAGWLNNWRLLDVTLYVTLEPCPMCAGAMIQARLSRLVYGAPDIRFGADGSVVDLLSDPIFNHKVEVESGVLAAEAAELLRTFFRSLRSSG